MAELQIIKSGGSGGIGNVEQLITIYNRIAKKCNKENLKGLLFLENC
jgi:hypothetical protein